jgi:hypothetical protein
MDRLDAAIRAENDTDMFAVFPLDIRRLVQTEPAGLLTIANGMGITVDGIRLTSNKPSTEAEINALADNIIADPTHPFQLRIHPASFGEVLVSIFQKRIDHVRAQGQRKRPTTKKSKRSSQRPPKRLKSRNVPLGKRRN